jgi:hypothetical protein
MLRLEHVFLPSVAEFSSAHVAVKMKERFR